MPDPSRESSLSSGSSGGPSSSSYNSPPLNYSSLSSCSGDPCGVNQFDISSDGSGTLSSGVHRAAWARFTVDAKFQGPTSECEYRQFVRGYREINGQKKPPLQLLGGEEMSETEYKEDGTPQGDRYGDRDRAASDGNQYTDNSGGVDQDSGPNYFGSDTPMIAGKQTDTYHMHLEFVCLLISADGCVTAAKTWVVDEFGTF